MSIEAARLWKEGMAPWILPSGKYSIGKGAFTGVQAMKEKYQGPYQTEWEFMKDVLLKEGVPEEVILRGRRGYIYLSECDQLQKSDRCSGYSGEKRQLSAAKPSMPEDASCIISTYTHRQPFSFVLRMWESTGKTGLIRKKAERKYWEK